MNENENQHTTETADLPADSTQRKKAFSWQKSALRVVVFAFVGSLFVLNTFAASEISKATIDAQYMSYTCHHADAGGLEYWYGALNRATSPKTMADLSYALSQTSAYTSRGTPPAPCPGDGGSGGGGGSTGGGTGGGTGGSTASDHTPAIVAAYNAELGRAPSAADIAAWNTRLQPNGGWTESQMRAQLDKSPEGQRYNAHTSGSGSGNGTCPDKNKVVNANERPGYTYHDNNEALVRDAYNRYTIFTGGWDMTAEMVAWVNHLDNCDKSPYTLGDLIKKLKESPAGQARIELDRKRAEYTARIEAALAQALRAALARQGGHFNSVNPLMRWDYCAELAANPATVNFPSFCFLGVGLPFPSVGAFVDSVLGGTISIEAAEEAARNFGSGSDPCAYAIGHGDSPACQGGFSNVEPRRDPQGTPTNPNPDRTTNSNSNTTTNGGASSNDSGYSPVDNPTTSAREKVQSDIKKRSEPAKNMRACSVTRDGSQSCAVLPLGTNRTSTASSESQGAAPVSVPTTSNECLPLLCGNQNDQEWTYDNPSQGTTAAPSTPSSSTTTASTKEVANCVDEYETLILGDESACVHIAQVYLWQAGYLPAVSESATPKFDATMKEAVISFQKDNKINPADGVISKPTWNALKIVAGRAHEADRQAADDQRQIVEVTTIAASENQAIILPKCQTFTTIKLGSTGSCVKRLQQMLILIQGSDLKISGTFDSETERAVKLFQDSRNLKATGVVDIATWRLLEIAANPAVHRSPFQSAPGMLLNGRIPR